MLLGEINTCWVEDVMTSDTKWIAVAGCNNGREMSQLPHARSFWCLGTVWLGVVGFDAPGRAAPTGHSVLRRVLAPAKHSSVPSIRRTI